MLRYLYHKLLAKFNIKGRDLTTFLISLLCACFIWLIHNLSLEYSSIVSVQVVATSNLEGRAAESVNQCNIAARCSMTGYEIYLLNKLSARKPFVVYFDAEDLRHIEGDTFSVSSEDLTGYFSDIFGAGAKLESFVTRSAQFRFPEENSKKVPIQSVQLLTFKSQYMPIGSIQTFPDSVEIFGDPSALVNVDRILTETISKDNLSSGIHGEVKLQAVPGVRLAVPEVEYSLDVSRYVEIRATVKVATKNVPAGKTLSVFPSTAEVVYRCEFPIGADPSKVVSMYIDYKDFVGSINGRCVPVPDGLPSGVLDYTIEPQVFDCFEDNVK